MRELRRRTRCLLDQLGQMSRTLCDRRNTQVIRVCELRALDEPLSLDVMLEEVSKVEELQKDVDRFGYELEKLLATRLEWNVIDRRRCAIEALVNGDMNGRDFSADTSTETLCNMDAPIDTPTSPRSSCTTRSDGTVDVSGDSKAVVLYNPCLLLGRRSAHPLKTQCTERPTEVSFGPLRTPALGRAEVWDDVQ
ncbi:hypothetical protein CERSUDRAFT_104616 [Gelatoporia subvermispora B]|uniref:Uncharacterized protein n=1 Tax=Ceriporiopsis subvermispora (strain B) TaxID=914234 RepID=M2RGP5_CERS8|nr:hypothetical protein CERSUDRAFT_104616 [Gelatoporia subvermispora B]